eukprot:scaffold1847_cov59-Phaeocystis_antarctica.AAC.4
MRFAETAESTETQADTDPKVTSATEVEPAQKDETSTNAAIEGAKESTKSATESGAAVEGAKEEATKESGALSVNAMGQMMKALGKFEGLAQSGEVESEERNPDDGRNPKEAMDQLRHLAGEILCAIAKLLAGDLELGLARLKERAQIKLDAFAESAAMPIFAALKSASNLEAVQLAKHLPEVRGYIEALKKELCEDALSKRITKGLMGAASKPLQGIGHGAEQTLALSLKFEQHLNKELNKVDEAAQKLLRRHLPEGSLRARAFDVLLKTATKYEVRVDGFEGSFDMLRLAWRRSRVALNTDENQLVYLSEKLKKLEDKESTAANWRDAAEGWISVLELRGQLRVQCGQAVLECMAADRKVLEALGAAKALMHIEGDTPPSALVAIIAQGPGAHIRKHGYRYARRIDKELVLIRRVKELQMRAITGAGTLFVATSIAVGNYFGRVMYDGVSKGFDSQSLLMWVPFAVIIGLLVVCCCFGRKVRRLAGAFVLLFGKRRGGRLRLPAPRGVSRERSRDLREPPLPLPAHSRPTSTPTQLNSKRVDPLSLPLHAATRGYAAIGTSFAPPLAPLTAHSPAHDPSKAMARARHRARPWRLPPLALGRGHVA